VSQLERRAQDVVLAWEQVCEAIADTRVKPITALPRAFDKIEEARAFLTALLGVGSAIAALHAELQNHSKLREDLMTGKVPIAVVK
jgi:hypothetical protein